MQKITGLLILFILILSSCKKEETISGCTDSTAVNYNEAANHNDGSCLSNYSSSITFWQDFTGSQNLDAATTGSLMKIYVEGIEVGAILVTDYSNIAPPCGTAGFSYIVNMGASQTKTVQYDIRYYNSSNVWVVFQAGTIDLTHGGCKLQQVIF